MFGDGTSKEIYEEKICHSNLQFRLENLLKRNS